MRKKMWRKVFLCIDKKKKRELKIFYWNWKIKWIYGTDVQYTSYTITSYPQSIYTSHPYIYTSSILIANKQWNWNRCCFSFDILPTKRFIVNYCCVNTENGYNQYNIEQCMIKGNFHFPSNCFAEERKLYFFVDGSDLMQTFCFLCGQMLFNNIINLITRNFRNRKKNNIYRGLLNVVWLGTIG